jgi:two-component system sensor histidine kinase BaeS
MMRLTIAKKIALAVIGIVMLCVGTMAWVTSQNLQRGFVAYLNQSQAEDLAQLGALMEQRYREHGNFDWLLHNRPALDALMIQIRPRFQSVDGVEGPPGQERQQFMRRRFERLHGGPPQGRPLLDGRPPPRPPSDQLGFGGRLAVTDASGRRVVGPPDLPPGLVHKLVVDGSVVGTLSLAPLVAIAGTSDAEMAISFVRGQIRAILLLSAVLMVIAILLALGLARHLLRPVVALRSVTARIAKGQFEARAPVPNRDELSELAQHVNEMAEALQYSEQRRRKTLADISHELRTPLTVIRGEIEAVLDGIRKADRSALESLHVEVLRLNKLVDDLHQLTLADAGDLHYHFETLDAGAMLASIVARFQPRVAGAGLALCSDLPPQPLMLEADAGRLTQVVINLLENSCRYTDAGGKIVLSLTVYVGIAEICLEDSAPGVPPEAHAKLFERLYRVDQARSRESGGNGLGLSICKVLVEAHGGKISAMASGLGGVKMLIRLPLQGPGLLPQAS